MGGRGDMIRTAEWTQGTSPVGISTRRSLPADLQGVTPHRLETPLSPMALLANGIPLSLLLDLVCGPQSADLMSQERQSEDWAYTACAQ